MKPEAAQYLEKARQALKEARAVAGIGLAEAAGRAAYLAAFHAAQALIFERSARVPKTHRGVHAQFSRLPTTYRSSAPSSRTFCHKPTISTDVDLFSDGRLRQGVGVGWNWVEYDGLEMSRQFRRRGE